MDSTHLLELKDIIKGIAELNRIKNEERYSSVHKTLNICWLIAVKFSLCKFSGFQESHRYC